MAKAKTQIKEIILPQDTDTTIFRTHDIYVASALSGILGYEIVRVEMDHVSRRGIFFLKDRPERSNDVRNYYSGTLHGSLKKFVNILSDLKFELRNMT